MRKLMLSTALILPLAVGPVFAQTATPDPATDAPATDTMTTDTPAADATMPAGTDADPAAEEAAAAAMQAEVAASGKVAQQQATNELRLEWITDATVTATDGTNIGDINDLIVDGSTGQMIAAVIGVGGFLGIGQKQIAVPWESLTVNYDAQEVTSQLTKEEADAAPEYVFREREAAPGTEAPAGDAGLAPAADPAMTPAADPVPVPATDPAADPAMEPADPAMEPVDNTMAPADGAMEPADGAATPAPAN